MNDIHPPNVKAVVGGYAAYFGPAAETMPFRLKAQAGNDMAIIVYLPEGPAAPTTLGTAGFSVYAVGDGFRAEFGIEIKGMVDAAIRRDMADAIITVASAPLQIGRPFLMNQTLGEVRLPLFEKFDCAMLVEWDVVYGFLFPYLPEPVTLLRIVPLFESEAKFVESRPDRRKAYLELVNGGMVTEDYDRRPVV